MGQGFKPPFDCQAIFLSPHADIDCPFAPNCERCSGDSVMLPQPPLRIGRRNRNRAPKQPMRSEPASRPARLRPRSYALGRAIPAPSGPTAYRVRQDKAAPLAICPSSQSRGSCVERPGIQERAWKTWRRHECGHVSGFSVRPHDRQPRWDPRMTSKQICGIDVPLTQAGF